MVEPELLGDRDFLDPGAHHAGKDLVQAEARCLSGHEVARIEYRLAQQLQDVLRTVAEDDALGRYRQALPDSLRQPSSGGVGIAGDAAVQTPAYSFGHRRRGAERAFVVGQLDHVGGAAEDCHRIRVAPGS